MDNDINNNTNNMDDDIISPFPPSNIIQCMNSDGTVNLLKYFMFSINRRKQLLQNTYDTQEWDSLVHEAINECINDEEYVDNCRRINNRQPTTRTRSTFQIGINRMRLADGTIGIITPKMSSWYLTYVVAPELGCKKFNEKFRRRFRCSYQSYQIILSMVMDHQMFGRWHQTFDAVGRECSPMELLVLGALRYLGRGWCFDDLEEATSISEEIHRIFFISL
jgi:hypothetical protein